MGVQHLPGASRGFTLIELMVVVTVMAMILLVGAPLASDWVHSAQTREARSKLEQGFGMAKAVAVRNPCQSTELTAAAQLQATVQSGQVVLAAAPACTTTASLAWSAVLPAGVQLALAGTTVTDAAPVVVSLDNHGLPLGSTTYSLRKGSSANDEAASLY